jgi:hypothetical protein
MTLRHPAPGLAQRHNPRLDSLCRQLSRQVVIRKTAGSTASLPSVAGNRHGVTGRIRNWRGRDGNDPSVDIAKDADQRF